MIDDEVVYVRFTDTKNLVKERAPFNWFQVLFGKLLDKLRLR